MTDSLINLNKKIIRCKKCPRLVLFREKIAKEKRKQYINEKYWGKPITGYGDPTARLLIIGLAPAAHGGNRTGRVFTGDRSADFLFRCLHGANLSNQANSDNINDGLVLNDAYITTALKCVPPGDKPLPAELKNCFSHFKIEINLLNNLNTVLALGKIAFDACINYYKSDFNIKNKDFTFFHGCNYILPDEKILVGSYHPSPRNVNTKRINEKKMLDLLKFVKKTMSK